MYGGWAVCRHPVSTVRRALAIPELSGSDTVSINIGLERLVDLTQTVTVLVGQQLDDAVGQEKMSSDVEPGDRYGNRGAAASAALPVSPVEYKQGPMVGGPEVDDIFSVVTDFCFKMTDLRRLNEEVNELLGSDIPDDPENISVYIRKKDGSGSGCCGGTSCEACESRGETCDTQTQQCFIGE